MVKEDALEYLCEREAYDINGGGGPKAVLLNHKSPETGGVEVLQRLETHPNPKASPVVVLVSLREERLAAKLQLRREPVRREADGLLQIRRSHQRRI
jgi:CheY-like chemotaxis protein